jgi:ligand-binding sensor domain-containing protein/AraC-like DNA-binding protein
MGKQSRSTRSREWQTLFVFWLLLFCFISPSLTALDPQQSVFQYVTGSWTREMGLPADSVVAVAQSPNGYLWIATPQGLCRFDGLKFTPVNIFDGPQPGYFEITSLFADQEGYLWVGSRGKGLWRLRGRRYKQFTRKHGLSGLSIECVYKDYRSNLWIGTDDGQLNRLTNNDEEITVFNPRPHRPGSPIYVIFGDSKGRLWVGMKREGLFRFQDDRFEKIPIPGFDTLDVHSLCEDRSGNLWLGTNRGLICFRVAEGMFDRCDEKNGLSHQIVHKVVQDSDGNIWVGTVNGLNRVGKSDEGQWQIEKSMDKIWIKTIFEDREKSLWIGTDGKGLRQLREGSIETFSQSEGLLYDYITSLYEDGDKNLWVGSTRGLIQFEQGALKPRSRRVEYTGSIVSAVCEDRQGSIWFGTFGSGLFHKQKDGSLSTYTTADGLLSDSIIALHFDLSGCLWIGTDNGLNCLRDGQVSSFTRADGLSRDIIYYIYEDRQGKIWIVYDQGFDLLQAQEWQSMDPAKFPENLVLTDIYEDADNITWLASRGSGLFKLQAGDIFQYTATHGLPGNTLHKIFADNDGYLWITGKQGIFKVARRELLDLAAGSISSVNAIPYGEKEGMKSEEITLWSLYSAVKTGDNRLLIGTKNGISIIDLEHFKINKLPPPVILERVIVNRNMLLDMQADNTLIGVKEISFYFTAPDFISPEQVGFKYRLEGYDRNWIFPEPGSKRLAHYGDLPAGAYTFTVTARNSHGVWNTTGASFNFTVEPRWVETPLFLILLVVACLLIGAGIYWLLTRTNLFRKEKYKGSTLDPVKAEHHVKKLIYLLEMEKVYRDESLSLQSLAEKLSITTYHLSQVINEKLNKNFFDLINGYRVEEAKEKLTDLKQEQTILGIGFEVGFNSKSAFNRVFKKFTHMTPSEFRKKHQKNNTP